MCIFGAIVGGVCGAVVAGVISIAIEIWNTISCSSSSSGTETTIFLVCISVGALIGFIIGLFLDIEEKEQNRLAEEREKEKQYMAERQQAEAERQAQIQRAEAERQAKIKYENQKFSSWDNKLTNFLSRIEKSVADYDCRFDFATTYGYIWNMESELTNLSENYKKRYNERLKNHKNYLNNMIFNNLKKETGPYNTKIALLALETLKIANKNDSGFDSAITALTDFSNASYWDTNFLGFIETSDGTKFNGYDNYGKIDFQLDDPYWMNFIDKEHNNIQQDVKNKFANILNNNTGYYEGITNSLDDGGWGNELLHKAACLMWYYAKKKPFDINKFNEAKDLYNIYADFSIDEDGTAVKVEVILAIIYYKNQLGGASVVNQDKKYIESWIESKVRGKWFDSVQILASGLAWMELYDLERDVLRKLVASGVSLEAKIQDRLGFLETGGTEAIPIYDRGNTSDFVYYNGSVDWHQKEFDILFRQLDMKDKVLDYSLLLNKWTKTLPLRKGQKISNDDIYKELLEMTEDFEGEVKCRKSAAKALDLENLIYENAVIFDFFSNRNRCLSVVFSSEKYGRNLNLTILTLFTPEEGLQNDEMKKYALAIQSNIYVESFRESILQALDTVLKEEKTVYDEEATDSKKKNIFE